MKSKDNSKTFMMVALFGVAMAGAAYTAMKKGSSEEPSKQQAEQTATTGTQSQEEKTYTPEQTTKQTETQNKPTSETSKKSGNKRANGLEIPAYLTDRDEEIVMHTGFTLSYNRKRLVPNWVAWVLTKERTKGNEKRAEDFQPDESIQKGPIALDTDYRGSGYDRGHMCPAADNKYNHSAMLQCFLLSNMCPQTHSLNAGDWKELEELSRKWAQKYDSIYIVCGPVIKKGVSYETIGENRVMVPKQFFKVFLRYTKTGEAETIGFVYNNDETTNHPTRSYAKTVDEVEDLTGINFFSKLPKDVERKAEATYDVSQWKGL